LHQIVDEYFDYLDKKQFIYFIEQSEIILFKDISSVFEVPCEINNAIIDFNNLSKHNFEKIFFELDLLGCRFIELRSYDVISIMELRKILGNIKGGKCLYINLILKYTDELRIQNLLALYNDAPFISQFIIHSSPMIEQNAEAFPFKVLYTKQIIGNDSFCGNISVHNFAINIPHYMEALKFNTCLNKKNSIDSNGFIKNCPSLSQFYGNISSDSLVDIAIKNKNFREYWYINKDSIKICRDCQFRYICTDCRAFVDDKFDKPFKCKYDPYNNIWESE